MASLIERLTDVVTAIGGDIKALYAGKATIAQADVAANTNAAVSKSTPIDADSLPLSDSASSFVLKKLTWANLKATLKTHFDTLYTNDSALNTHVADATGAHAAAAISNTPSGNLAATTVQAALNELQTDIDTRALNSGLTTANSNLTNHLNDTVDAHDASAISSVASGNLAATTVQDALDELQTDVDTREKSISAATAKTTPVDADTMGLIDSAASSVLKKVTWANIKTTLKAYFDTLYATISNLNLKANIASPTFTGTPAAPTATDGTSTTQIATTAFVQGAVQGYLNKTGLTGGTITLTAVEASNVIINLAGTLTSNLIVEIPTVTRSWIVVNATTGAFTVTVKTTTGTGVTVAQGKRNLVYGNGTNINDAFNDFESVALTGVPTAPTAALNTNTTQIATTAFVQAETADQLATATPQPLGTAAVGNGTKFARDNHVHAMPTLDALANTTITSNSTGEILRWNGTAWVNSTLSEAGAIGVSAIGTTVQAYDANTAKTNVAQVYTSGQRGEVTALTDGATITPNFNDSNFFSVTLAGNRVLANPTNLVAGQSGCIFITQDATGSRTLAYGSYWDFAGGTAPSLSTGAGKVDRLDYVVRTASSIHAVLSKDWS